MSKEKQKEIVDPFKHFGSLQGKFAEPDKDIETDITTGDEGVIDDKDDLEAQRIAEGDKKLKEQEEKLKAKEAKKQKEETPEVLDEEEEEIEEQEPEEDELKSGIKEFTDNLYNKGVLEFDSSDPDFDGTEESIGKLLLKSKEKLINDWASKLDPDFQKFLEFTQSGGKPKDFLDVYYGNHSWETFTLDNEENQKVAVKESLRLAGEDPNDIEEIVTEWFDNGTLEKRAKSALTKLQKHESTQKAEIVEITKAKDLERKKREQEDFENFKKELYSKDEVLGFKFTPKVKDKLWEFMTVPDRTGKTGYDKALEQNRDAQYLFALQAMNGFDINKLEQKVETKVTKKVNNLFKNYSTSSKDKISKGSTQEFEEQNNFSQFKTLR